LAAIILSSAHVLNAAFDQSRMDSEQMRYYRLERKKERKDLYYTMDTNELLNQFPYTIKDRLLAKIHTNRMVVV
jgi:hypothetical protein